MADKEELANAVFMFKARCDISEVRDLCADELLSIKRKLFAYETRGRDLAKPSNVTCVKCKECNCVLSASFDPRSSELQVSRCAYCEGRTLQRAYEKGQIVFVP